MYSEEQSRETQNTVRQQEMHNLGLKETCLEEHSRSVSQPWQAFCSESAALGRLIFPHSCPLVLARSVRPRA